MTNETPTGKIPDHRPTTPRTELSPGTRVAVDPESGPKPGTIVKVNRDRGTCNEPGWIRSYVVQLDRNPSGYLTTYHHSRVFAVYEVQPEPSDRILDVRDLTWTDKGLTATATFSPEQAERLGVATLITGVSIAPIFPAKKPKSKNRLRLSRTALEKSHASLQDEHRRTRSELAEMGDKYAERGRKLDDLLAHRKELITSNHHRFAENDRLQNVNAELVAERKLLAEEIAQVREVLAESLRERKLLADENRDTHEHNLRLAASVSQLGDELTLADRNGTELRQKNERQSNTILQERADLEKLREQHANQRNTITSMQNQVNALTLEKATALAQRDEQITEGGRLKAGWMIAEADSLEWQARVRELSQANAEMHERFRVKVEALELTLEENRALEERLEELTGTDHRDQQIRDLKASLKLITQRERELAADLFIVTRARNRIERIAEERLVRAEEYAAKLKAIRATINDGGF